MQSRKLFLLNLNEAEKKEYSKLFRKQRKNKKDYKPKIEMTMEELYRYNEIYKIGYLDIETEGLVADFGVMFSYAIYVRDLRTGKLEIRNGVVTKEDLNKAIRKGDYDLYDERILRKLIKDIADLDLLIGHWFIGKHRHDIPFIRTRCAINKISGFPKYGMVRYADTQKYTSTIHRLHSSSLESAGDAYGISTKKTVIKTKHWKNARIGKKDSLKYILEHNIKDVKLTYHIHKREEAYVPIPSTYY